MSVKFEFARLFVVILTISDVTGVCVYVECTDGISLEQLGVGV